MPPLANSNLHLMLMSISSPQLYFPSQRISVKHNSQNKMSLKAWIPLQNPCPKAMLFSSATSYVTLPFPSLTRSKTVELSSHTSYSTKQIFREMLSHFKLYPDIKYPLTDFIMHVDVVIKKLIILCSKKSI